MDADGHAKHSVELTKVGIDNLCHLADIKLIFRGM